MTESEASHMKHGLSFSPRGSIASNLQGLEYEKPNTSYQGTILLLFFLSLFIHSIVLLQVLLLSFFA